MASNKFRLALVQMAVGAAKSENLQHAAKLVAEAAKAGAQVVALPECCNSPYGNSYFPEYAEPVPSQSTASFANDAKSNNIFLVADNGEELAEGESVTSFAKMAKDNGVFLVAGSIPEREGDKLYNTCTVFNPEGKMIAKHRKVHLFDIDIPGKFKFQESATISPGNSMNTFETPFCKIGLGICYDIRFAEMAQVYAKNGCDLLLYPGAFAMTTGPAHWELLARGRALDNQVYVASVSPARDEGSGYVAWGHSLVVNPWGEVIGATDEKESIVYADIDLDYAKEVREQIPIRKQRRDDVYTAGVNAPKL